MNEEDREDEVFHIEIGGEDIVVYKRITGDCVLWTFSYDHHYILKEDGKYYAYTSKYHDVERESLSQAFLKIRSHIKQDIKNK